MPFNAKNILFSTDKKVDNEDLFKENVKNSFIRAKEHINAVENELKSHKELSAKQEEKICSLLAKLEQIMAELSEIKAKIAENEKSSSGNQGVYADIHSFTKQLFIQPMKERLPEKPIEAISISRQKLNEAFRGLSKQELLTYLTIYQLEEDNNAISYVDVAKHLKLSEGCIRTYISSLVKKGIPLSKIKHNNKQVFLAIPKEFRAIGMKKELMNIYYMPVSPEQKTLKERF